MLPNAIFQGNFPNHFLSLKQLMEPRDYGELMTLEVFKSCVLTEIIARIYSVGIKMQFTCYVR